MQNILIYFITGGVVTTAIVLLEESGLRLLSGLATLMPVFTLIAYFFVGESRGGIALSKHAELVLVGTLVAWVPYMLVVIYLAPRADTSKTIGIALAAFFAFALVFLLLTQHYGWFE
ncbi:GlpM family protein [Patescibacteria group bacterium]|nr:GlpM family protein [Patescibacteria group bacterium]